MRNTITLNGKDSSEIAGLLIQSLPPITKPLMRTQIEEIDGRDGDIVTDLGFSSYQKDIKIGLYGEFDINEVIAYFNSKGIVTFSNEPDKYYNYEIINQIDFERLIRFRTATVSMHCQPFKYSALEGDYILDAPASNLLTIPDFTKTTNGVTVTVSSGTVSVTGTPTAATEVYVPITALPLAIGSYTLKATSTGTNPSKASIRMIGSTPSNPDSFGNKYIALAEGTVTIDATISAAKTFNYIWFYINAGSALDFITTFAVENQAEKVAAAEGNDIVLENTSEAPFSQLDLKGDTDQTTYSGKNLLDVPSTFTVTNSNVYRSIPVSIPSGTTVCVQCDNLTTNSTKGCSVRFQNSNLQGIGTVILYPNTTLSSSVTLSGDAVYCYVYSSDNYADSQSATTTYTNLMVSIGSSAQTYEPYVGGIASPNPDYPQDVQMVTGEQTVLIAGKNLFNSYDITEYNHSKEVATVGVEQDGTITLSGNTGSNGYCRFFAPFKTIMPSIEAGKTYYAYIKNDFNNRNTIYMYGSTSGWNDGEAHTITQAELDGDFVLYGGYQTTSHIKIMITTTQDSNYEPYQSQRYTISLGSTELCKIGDYQDYFYKDEEDWYIHKELGKVDLSSLTWSVAATTLKRTTDITNMKYVSNNQEVGVALAEKYIVRKGSGLSAADCLGYMAVDVSAFAVNVGSGGANPSGLLYYALATPTNTKITDTSLIEQLDDLSSQAHSYKGRTHITATATGTNLPHIIEATVLADIGGSIVNSGNTTAKPTLTIYGSGNIGVTLNGNQIFNIALGNEGYITIDTNAMEAYQDTTDNLKNRLVDGDYDNFALQTGENTIEFSGTVEKCIVSNYSRWL